MRKQFAAILLATVFLSCCQTALATGNIAKTGFTQKTALFSDTALLIIKNVKNLEITIGEDALIEISVENTGDTVLYDVNVTDTIFELWSFTIHGFTSLAYNQIDPGQKIIHIYAMTPKKAGNYTLKPAAATYYTKPASAGERLEYQSRSNEAVLVVSEATEIDILPLMLLNFFSAVTIFYIVFVFINTFSLLRNRKRAEKSPEEIEKE